MEIARSKMFYAILTIGLRRGYSEESIPVQSIYEALRNLQERIIQEKNIYLSANCFESMVVLSGQKEPHLNIKFINYPRFQLEEDVFKNEITLLATYLMKAFDQNRVVIEFNDGFVMLQENDAIDKSIVLH